MKLCPICKAAFLYQHPEALKPLFSEQIKCRLCGYAEIIHSDPQDMFRLEKITYKNNEQNLLETALDRWVTIRGTKILGTWKTELEAVNNTIDKVGQRPFFIRKVIP